MGSFDGAVTLLGAAFTGDLFLDGWAHTHGRVDDTFFTPVAAWAARSLRSAPGRWRRGRSIEEMLLLSPRADAALGRLP